MQLFTPTMLWWGLTIPAVVLLYLLKQQYQDMQISSTYLWEQALRDLQATTPWQRLRKSLLLLLQLLILIFTVFALTRPFWGMVENREIIAVLDISASMQASDVAPSRFQAAVAELESLANAMLPDETMTLIVAGDQVETVLSQSSDQLRIRQVLAALKPGFGGDSCEQALALADSIRRQQPNARVLAYTDHYPTQAPGQIQWRLFNGSGINAWVAAMSYARDDTGAPVIFTRIQNDGPAATWTLECRVDGKLTDVKTLDCPEDGTAHVYWSVPVNARRVEVEIVEKDKLASDNIGFLTIPADESRRVLLITQHNIFLEKAIILRTDLELFKTTPGEGLTALEGYDMYIFDGVVPDEYPQGTLVFFNPDRPIELPGMRIEPEAEITKYGYVTVPDTALSGSENLRRLTRYTDLSAVHVGKYRPLGGNSEGAAGLYVDDQVLLRVGQSEGRRVLALGFDLHNTDWPMLPDFPIFVQNLLQWALPQTIETQSVTCGDTVQVHGLAESSEVKVIAPDGSETRLAPPFPILGFAGTTQPGVYEVRQTVGNETTTAALFTAHIPQGESNLRLLGVAPAQSDVQTNGTNAQQRRELWRWLILLALLVILGEWWVYVRGI